MQLQVALDVLTLKDAKRIARQAIKGGADILEAGTILIKSKGMEAVRVLKKFGKPVCADLKTMDVGALEARVAIRAGADIVTVEGWAANETIRRAIRTAKRLRAEIMVGTTGRDASYEIIREMCRLKPHYLLKHIGIDIQPKVDVVKAIKEFEVRLARRYGVKLAIAGGLNPEKIARLKPYRQDIGIYIVGAYITKSKNPLKATQRVKNAIENLYPKLPTFS